MREDFVSEFCDLYWNGLSANPADTANIADCRDVVGSLVSIVLAIEERPGAPDDAGHEDPRLDTAANQILELLRATPDVTTVGLLQRASIDVITSLVRRLAAAEGREPEAVWQDLQATACC
jgi:hypothetical protein